MRRNIVRLCCTLVAYALLSTSCSLFKKKCDCPTFGKNKSHASSGSLTKPAA